MLLFLMKMEISLYHPDNEMANKNIKNFMNNQKQMSPFMNFLKIYQRSKTKKSSYIWNNPNDKENFNYKKISWVQYLPDAKIYICITGYENEIKETSNDLENLLIEHSLIKLILILFFSLLFLGMIIRPIIRLSKLSKEVQNGNYNVRSDIKQR